MIYSVPYSTETRPLPHNHLVGLVVKVSALRATDLSSIPTFPVDVFLGQVIPVTSKLGLQWLPCKAPGGIASALGLTGLVSVYCDWVR